MASPKNKTILINKEAYGTFVLIQNQILGKFNRLMNEQEASIAEKTGYFQNEPMPYAFTFAPFGKRNQEVIQNIKNGQKIDLLLDDEIIGHIKAESSFLLKNPKNSIFRARDLMIPYEKKVGKYAISGEFEIYKDNLKDMIKSVQSRTKNAKKITALMLTADPMNRLHERLIRLTIDKADIVIIFLVRTFGNDGRLSFALRREILEFFINKYINKDRIILIPFENTYLFSDHINPVLECIAAKHFGATKLVVGQKHGGIGMYYDNNTQNTILDKYSDELDMELIVMPEMVYCTDCRTIVSTKTCPHGAHHHIKYSAHTIKELLFNGIMPPAILVRKDISAMILSKLFPNRFDDLQKMYDDLFPNNGLVEEHSRAEFYEQLMNLYQTSSLT